MHNYLPSKTDLFSRTLSLVDFADFRIAFRAACLGKSFCNNMSLMSKVDLAINSVSDEEREWGGIKATKEIFQRERFWPNLAKKVLRAAWAVLARIGRFHSRAKYSTAVRVYYEPCARARAAKIGEIAIQRWRNNTNFNYPRLAVPVVIKWDVHTSNRNDGWLARRASRGAPWALFPERMPCSSREPITLSRNYIIIIETDTRI